MTSANVLDFFNPPLSAFGSDLYYKIHATSLTLSAFPMWTSYPEAHWGRCSIFMGHRNEITPPTSPLGCWLAGLAIGNVSFNLQRWAFACPLLVLLQSLLTRLEMRSLFVGNNVT